MLRYVTTAMIRLYQMYISVHLPPSCRFLPTCSEYTRLAIETHGVARGVWLGMKRIGRCHPWGGRGFDPVPGRGEG
ncbi:MAG: membrane protein insertion efficiency factor YidD [Gemmatimonadetes bacterium]|nr:membrane protein insertion efficiency factor YidD [Gemmatimonadota bacterium]MXX70626.1 membrane protein insertion efficiency factor YidD [Gemmatimonadota bacterium]MYC92447.1 membrane protein insertion efficiency factor YidD [Gemmatimonadota bacterium]MYG34021.1 membrane protein insertion efficiency factor YidD [Gemmatimonadota bacterium]MYJ17494.1 membrane protein insertion efficiency factor YidD [Gemmatimonadota bacterium]